jgi:hypothetical protein
MAITNINIILVVLALKQTSIPALVQRATAIVSAMTANKATFPSPTPPLATVLADIAALQVAETALKNRLGTRADRDDKKQVVVADMGQLHGYVQTTVNANPSQAEVIAADAAMTLRKKGAHSKAPLAVKQTVSGSVQVVAKATVGAKANEWQYSTDGGKTWIDVPSTTKAKTTIPNLTPGATVMYRQRVVTKDGVGNWSQTISALVT